MRYLPSLSPLLLVLLLPACQSEPQLQGSTPDELKQSKEKIVESLDSSRAVRFERAYETVAREEVGNAIGSALFGGQSPEDAGKDLLSSLDGRTPSDIIEMADSLNQEKIEEVEEELASMKEAQSNLEGVIVENAEIRFPEDRFLDPRPVVTIKNETEHPLSIINFFAEWKSEGRPVAWWDGKFFCKPDGGLKVGETKEMRCYFRGVGEPEQRESAKFSFEVVGFKGPDGSPDISVEGSIEEKMAEIDSLRSL